MSRWVVRGAVLLSFTRLASVPALVSPGRTALLAIVLLVASLVARPALAQDNYEIQVYGAETVPTGATMVELHSNYALSGRRTVEDGVLPTNHALHETLEITRGINGWMEVGFYTFTSARSGQGWQWVGNHVRPRARSRRLALARRCESLVRSGLPAP